MAGLANFITSIIVISIITGTLKIRKIFYSVSVCSVAISAIIFSSTIAG